MKLVHGLALLLAASPASAQHPHAGTTPGSSHAIRVVNNDNTIAAGTLTDGVLTIRLTARDGEWHPDAGPGERMHAFAEGDGAPHIPGPLVRVPAATDVRARVRNALADTLWLYGLHDRVAGVAPDRRALRLAPGEEREVRFRLDAPGTYHYWGATSDSTIATRYGPDTQLIGAIVVDEPGAATDDRVFVISSWTELPDTTGPPPHVYRDMVAVNGRSWPHTERFEFTVGDTVRWRWISPDSRPHPMHLHGFYFDVTSRGDGATDTLYSARDERRAVTESLAPGNTMAIRFVPDRPGRWLFHCHLAFHVSHFLSFAKIPDPEDVLAGDGIDHSVHGMAGLILAMDVVPEAGETYARAPTSGRPLRLHVTGGMVDVGHEVQERLAYVVERDGVAPAADSVPVVSAPLVLRRGEPVHVTILNRTRVPTAVHWHGVEVEDAYADGVPGYSGTSSSSTTPLIAPGDSFVAAFTPPRSGTFMFHSHSNEFFQIDAGLAAALIVMDDPAQYDPQHDVVVMVTGDGIGFHNEDGWVNGSATPAAIELARDAPTRLRLVSINPDRVLLFTLLSADGDTLTWRPLAKDGADLPPHQAVPQPAHRRIGVGEILDVEVGPLDRPAVLAVRPLRPLFRVELPLVSRSD